MTSPRQWDNLIGATAADVDGDKIGKVGQVYLNDGTGEPEWVTVSTGLFGTRESFAPLYRARSGDGELRLAVTKQQVKEAPTSTSMATWGPAEQETLYRHYAGHPGAAASAAGAGQGIGTADVDAAGGAGAEAVTCPVQPLTTR